MKPDDYQYVFQEAQKYLLGFVDNKTLKKHLKEGETKSPKTLKESYKGLLSSLINKRNMPNSIGKIENLGPYLYDFNPKKIHQNYGDDW